MEKKEITFGFVSVEKRAALASSIYAKAMEIVDPDEAKIVKKCAPALFRKVEIKTTVGEDFLDSLVIYSTVLNNTRKPILSTFELESLRKSIRQDWLGRKKAI